MNNKLVAQEWFAFAEADLQSALFLLKMHPAPFEIICYHCQQSAEKYLKGFIALNGGERQADKELRFRKCRVLNLPNIRKISLNAPSLTGSIL